jgi:hypothetical protein
MTALTSPTMPRRLPYRCVEDRDRHGNIRYYYRPEGFPKVRLRGVPFTPGFMAQYEAALKSSCASIPSLRAASAGTWRALVIRYLTECADYLRYDPRQRKVRRQILEATFTEPIAPGSPKLFGNMPLAHFTSDAIEVLRDRKLDTPEGANNRVKAIRAVCKWAVRKKGADGKTAHANQRRP